MEENEKASATIEMDKELLLIFKSVCVLKEVTMSSQVEAMIRDWVARNSDAEPGSGMAGTKNSESLFAQEPGKKSPGTDELSDEIEKQSEGN